jgi:hypothetical protein
MAQHRAHYQLCEPHVKAILHVLIELWETARQCGTEDALTFHMQHENYKAPVKKALQAELSSRLEVCATSLTGHALSTPVVHAAHCGVCTTPALSTAQVVHAAH